MRAVQIRGWKYNVVARGAAVAAAIPSRHHGRRCRPHFQGRLHPASGVRSYSETLRRLYL